MTTHSSTVPHTHLVGHSKQEELRVKHEILLEGGLRLAIVGSKRGWMIVDADICCEASCTISLPLHSLPFLPRSLAPTAPTYLSPPGEAQVVVASRPLLQCSIGIDEQARQDLAPAELHGGLLDGGDKLRNAHTNETKFAVDFQGIRGLLRAAAAKEQEDEPAAGPGKPPDSSADLRSLLPVGERSPSMAGPRAVIPTDLRGGRGATSSGGKSRGGTMMLIVVVLAAFAAAGWWLWQRSG